MVDFKNIGKINTIKVLEDLVEIGVINGLDRIQELQINSKDAIKDIIVVNVIITMTKYINFND